MIKLLIVYFFIHFPVTLSVFGPNIFPSYSRTSSAYVFPSVGRPSFTPMQFIDLLNNAISKMSSD
jgi:hypothetical protein